MPYWYKKKSNQIRDSRGSLSFPVGKSNFLDMVLFPIYDGGEKDDYQKS